MAAANDVQELRETADEQANPPIPQVFGDVNANGDVPIRDLEAASIHHHSNYPMLACMMACMPLFVCIVCCGSLAGAGLSIWLIVAFANYMKAGGQDCDFPVKNWFIVQLAMGIGISCLSNCTNCFCCYTRKKGEIPPLRVQLYTLVVLYYSIAWNALGIYYGSATGSGNPVSCRSLCPNLLNAMVAVGIVGVILLGFVGILTHGLVFSQIYYQCCRRRQ